MTKEEARNYLLKWIEYATNPESHPFIDAPCSDEEILEAMRIGAEALSKPELPSNLDEVAEEYEHNLGYYECMNQWPSVAFKAGAEWMAGRGWISVDERLPEMDEEVIVLSDELGTAPIYKIAFGHIVDVRCIDYNGWNIPGVKYWMPCPEIPGMND